MGIKIDSEWISNTGYKFTVKAIDEDKLFVKFEDGEYMIIAEEKLRELCKPLQKRRTVWLNVYKGTVTCHSSKFEADMNCTDGLLWQQAVELIDPREGEKG